MLHLNGVTKGNHPVDLAVELSAYTPTCSSRWGANRQAKNTPS